MGKYYTSRCWFSVTQTLIWIYVYRSVTYISWSSDFALYLEDYLLDKCILVPCDAKIYLIKCMWVSDLHLMVHWFCIISWRLFDVLMLYWRYQFSVTQTLKWNYICRSVTYISWSSDFALYPEDYLMDKCHNCKLLDPCDAKIYHIKCMWVSDLHFMIQWLVLYLKDYLMD